MKLSEFKTTQEKKEQQEPNKQELNQKDIEEIYNKFKDKSQSEIMQELFGQVQKQKQNGTFDYDKICSMVELMSPYLNQEQKNNILTILSKLK